MKINSKLIFTSTFPFIAARKLQLGDETGTETSVFTASSDCPCINPWETDGIDATRNQGSCDNGYFEVLDAADPSKIKCLPYDYGVDTCGTWEIYGDVDASICDEALTVEKMPSYCFHFCFVDEDACTYISSDWTGYLDPNTNQEYDFSVSYYTCGERMSYSEDYILDSLRGSTLRITYPGESDDGYNVVETIDGDSKTASGAFVDLLEEVVADYSIDFVAQNVTAKSYEKFPDGYSACVHDVMLGETDLCIGPFLITKSRLLYSAFTVSLYNAEIVMISYRSTDPSFLDELVTPLKPFTYEAWALIFTVIIYMSSVLIFVRGEEEKLKLKLLPTWIANRFYIGANSFTGGAVEQSEEPSVAEKFIVFGFNIFALIVLTAYTATSAAALVQSSSTPEYSTLKNVFDANAKVCTQVVFRDILVGLYKGYNFEDYEVQCPHFGECLQMMDNSMCDVIVSDADMFRRVLADGNEHCDKGIAQLIVTVPISMPVTSKFYTPLNYAIGERVIDGTFEEMKITNQDTYVGDSTCDSTIDDDDVVELGIFELSSPILFSGFFTTIGLLISVWKKRESDKSEPDESAKDGEDNLVTSQSKHCTAEDASKLISKLKSTNSVDPVQVDEVLCKMLQLMLDMSLSSDPTNKEGINDIQSTIDHPAKDLEPCDPTNKEGINDIQSTIDHPAKDLEPTEE